MESIDNLKELDNFEEIKTYIKNFIIDDSELWKLIFYGYKNPLLEDYSDNPYQIFESSNEHGCILFRQKNDVVLSDEQVNILVKFTTDASEDNNYINYTKIQFSIICKGTNIQDLENEKSRPYVIAQLIDNYMNHGKIQNSNKIKRLYFDNLSINEENCGHKLEYQIQATSYSDEIQIYQHEQKEDTWGITRETHSLLITENPIFVGIQEPATDSKLTKQYGYDIDIIKIMYCDINLNISESSLIKHKDKFYRIKEILEYENYWKCTLEVTYNAVINE